MGPVPIPAFKAEEHRGALYGSRQLKRSHRYNAAARRGTRQSEVWRNDLGRAMVPVQILEEKARRAVRTVPDPAGKVYEFQYPPMNRNLKFTGTIPEAVRKFSVPKWNGRGAATSYQVDHIVELQLSNWPADKSWANTLENMELLEQSTNASSGSVLKGLIEEKIKEERPEVTTDAQVQQFKREHDIVFSGFSRGPGGSVGSDKFWTKAQIEQGRHLTPVRVLREAQNPGTKVVASPEPEAEGKRFGQGELTPDEQNWLKPFKIASKQFNPEGEGGFGQLVIHIPDDDPHFQAFPPTPVPLARVGEAQDVGYLSPETLTGLLGQVRYKKLSPVRVDEMRVGDEGIYAAGAILPEAPFFRDIGLEFEVIGGDLTVFKEFNTGEINVPAPFSIRDCSLVLSIGTATGLGIAGQVDFGIDRVGEGYLRAAADMASGVSLEGGFDFDTQLFDQASITMRDNNEGFSGEGRLTIGPDKVRGVRSASIDVSYAQGQLSAMGRVQPSIPGVQEGTLTVEYSEAEGFLIGGTLQLTEDVPGIRGGSVEIQLRKNEEGYKLRATGTAQPAIPGVDATLTVAYDDGAFTIEGSAAYQRGMLSGSIQLGVTNRPVDPEGNADPGGEPGDTLRAYGGGQVSIRIAPWLQGTIGVKLLPNGEIEVTGEVGLPDALNLFEEKRYDKNIFRMPSIDIPIVGVSVAGQRIGIFATISGGLDATAGVGPGQLRDLGIRVRYNPDHEDQTEVSGSARLHIPADAGLRLYVRGGLGAGIPIVSASAQLEVGGSLGIEGAVEAGVDVNWTPAQGLKLDAEASIYAQPKFTFDVTGMVLVEADLLFTSVELYSKRWRLASFEYGSNLRFGVRFPIHYEEGQPFDVSLSDMEFEVPEISPRELLGGLIDRLA